VADDSGSGADVEFTNPGAPGGPPPAPEWLFAPREVRRVSDNGITVAVEAASITNQRVDVLYLAIADGREGLSGIAPTDVSISDNSGQVFEIERVSKIGDLAGMTLGIISFDVPDINAGAPISLSVRSVSGTDSTGALAIDGSWMIDFLKRGDYSEPFDGKWVTLRPATSHMTVEPPVVNGPLSPFSVTVKDEETGAEITYYFQVSLEDGLSRTSAGEFEDAMGQIPDSIEDRYDSSSD
jgi:hypothetical protein